MSEVTHAIPLNQSYVFQAAPVDSTLKGLVTRWAKDAGLTLAYLHPNDYTLFAPVARIRTYSAVEAAAALSAAYADQHVAVAVDGNRLVVSVAGSPAPAAAPTAVAPATSPAQ
ncbi:TcpQ domain-containing protein [Xanthomonas sp. 60]